MLLDDAIAIECEYPSINQGETGNRWFRIKMALSEGQKPSTNTGSPKLPTFEEFREYWMSEKHQNALDLYRWFVGNIRAGA
jgi:hypothetical protein